MFIILFFRFALNQTGSGGENSFEYLRVVITIRMLHIFFVEVIFISCNL